MLNFSGPLWPNSWKLIIFVATALTCVLWSAKGASLEGVFPCDKVASPDGSQLYITVQQLADSLQAGQTGCLREGVYTEDVTVAYGGSSEDPITIRSYPGEQATVVGRLWVTDDANFVRFYSLHLDGQNAGNLPSPTINGDNITFAENDVTSSGTCFTIGVQGYGRAVGTVIERNRIHDCGPLASGYQHGIDINAADDTAILFNVIYDNADRGIQLYLDAQNTYIVRNVVDGNGEGISFGNGEEPNHDCTTTTVAGSVVQYNIISSSRVRWNVEEWWGADEPPYPCLVGTDNLVQDNCVWPDNQNPDPILRPYYNTNGGIYKPPVGFTQHGDAIVDPQFVDRSAKDFTLQPGSPCRTLFGPIPSEGDADGDGCTDKQELGSNPGLGGRRDWLNPWDFYDTNGDKVIDLFSDIFNVAFAFGLTPSDAGYSTTLDRSAPLPGDDVWDMQAPDGIIDLFTDIFGVAFQFGHDCTYPYREVYYPVARQEAPVGVSWRPAFGPSPATVP